MFVHLRAHSEYSVVDGTLRIDDAIEAAASNQQPAMAITDLSNTFGALKLYKAGRGAGVKPIIGAEVFVESPKGQLVSALDTPSDFPDTRVILLVQNIQGWHNLSELLARGWTKNTIKEQAVLKWEWLRDLNEGLIMLSGASQGPIGECFRRDLNECAVYFAQFLQELFPSRFYLEVQRIGLPGENELVVRTALLAHECNLPVVATHPIQFLNKNDYEAHEARVCVSEGTQLGASNRKRLFSRNQNFKTKEEMQKIWQDLPSAVENTVEIARRCSLVLVLDKPQLPDFPTPDGSLIEVYLRTASFDGLEKRLQMLFPNEEAREKERQRYVDRLEFELKTIIGMGFPGYFLIVSDFIVWAKGNGCPVGPGRGSGAGSLVAYALFITDLDPLRYNLLFERFLNPDRVSMPDFDIDFCQSNRDRVIDYVKDKYGHEAVSQIATFGTMAAKASLRDIGRVMGMGYGFVDSISKLIPAPPGKSVTLAHKPPKPAKNTIYARDESPDLVRRENEEEEVANLLRLASQVEGTVRNIGMHAGGVLIAPGKITDFCPLYMQPGSNSAVSQFDKDDVEKIGLVKFDFLGLATLTILEIALEFIRKRRSGMENFVYETLDLEDAKVYDLFSEGRTEAVFQFESTGMQKMLREAKPSRLEDLIALNALYRPGPMDLIPTFIERKHGREEVIYPHPLVSEMLSETYGIMVYQEQVMQTAQILGGYTLGGADLLRRAMGKKKVEEMVMHRATFREGAAKNGIDQPKADEIFDLMEKFAGYGFNKSHAAAYSLLAYQTGWIKVHATVEFFAANLTVESDDTEKVEILIKDAATFGINVDKPDINHGVWRFVPTADDRLQYGLGAIKGTGSNAIAAIVREREANGPYKSIFDFMQRIDRKNLNKRTVGSLIKAGAFDLLHPDRDQLFANIDQAFGWALVNEKSIMQTGLFDFGDVEGSLSKDPDMVPGIGWSIMDKLQAEREAMGFCFSGHFYDYYRKEVSCVASTPLGQLKEVEGARWYAGIIMDIRHFSSARGNSYQIRIEDGTGLADVSFNERQYAEYKDYLKKDELLIVEAKVNLKGVTARLNISSCLNLIGLRSRFAKYLRVVCDRSKLEEKVLDEVLNATKMKRLRTEDGVLGLPVLLHIQDAKYKVVLDLGEKCRISPSDESLKMWMEKFKLSAQECSIEYS